MSNSLSNDLSLVRIDAELNVVCTEKPLVRNVAISEVSKKMIEKVFKDLFPEVKMNSTPKNYDPIIKDIEDVIGSEKLVGNLFLRKVTFEKWKEGMKVRKYRLLNILEYLDKKEVEQSTMLYLEHLHNIHIVELIFSKRMDFIKSKKDKNLKDYQLISNYYTTIKNHRKNNTISFSLIGKEEMLEAVESYYLQICDSHKNNFEIITSAIKQNEEVVLYLEKHFLETESKEEI